MEYKSRTLGGRQPSGGNLNAPISGLGKLPIGSHVVTVLSVVKHPTYSTVIWADSANHCHVEDVRWVPPEVARGTTGRLLVGFSHGVVLCRDGGRYCAQNSGTLEQETEWRDTPQAVYDDVCAAGLRLAITEVREFAHEHGRFEPELYTPASATSTPTHSEPPPPARL